MGTLDMQPLITVAMPVYNSAKTLSLAVRSILLQTYPHWELYLVDDGSTDDTLEVARRFTDPRIRLIADSQNRGLAVRLNQIIDACAGKYLARLDGDDLAYPERLARQLDYLESHPEVDLLGTRVMLFEGDGKACGRLPGPTTHEHICRRPWSGFYMPHPTWMGRMNWFRAHRYDPRAFMAEDQDLLLRSCLNSRFAALPEILVGYRQERVPLKKILQSRYTVMRSLLRTARSSGKLSWVVRGVPGQIAKAGVDAVSVALGLERGARRRVANVTTIERASWNAVWAQLHGAAG
jgi:glycosyltransferase involved in cell wall biosynthesis